MVDTAAREAAGRAGAIFSDTAGTRPQVAGPATVGDRTALEFGDALDPERKERCYFGVELEQGMALIWARLPVGPGGVGAAGDICAEGERVAEELSPYLHE